MHSQALAQLALNRKMGLIKSSGSSTGEAFQAFSPNYSAVGNLSDSVLARVVVPTIAGIYCLIVNDTEATASLHLLRGRPAGLQATMNVRPY